MRLQANSNEQQNDGKKIKKLLSLPLKKRRQEKLLSSKASNDMITTFSRFDRLMLQVLKGFIMKCRKDFFKQIVDMPHFVVSILELPSGLDFIVEVRTNVVMEDSCVATLKELFASFTYVEGVRAALDSPVTLKMWTELDSKTTTFLVGEIGARTTVEERSPLEGHVADVGTVLFFTVNGDLKADLYLWQSVLAEILLFSPFITMNVEFRATNPATSFISTCKAMELDYPIMSDAYKRASLVRFYRATDFVDVMEKQNVNQFKMYMLINSTTRVSERPFIELKVLQNGFFVEPTLEALTAFLKTPWPGTSIVIDDVFKPNDVPVGFYFHTSGPVHEQQIKNLTIIIEWIPLGPPRLFGDEPVTKLPTVLSKYVTLGFEKLCTVYPELNPPQDIVHRVRPRRSRAHSEEPEEAPLPFSLPPVIAQASTTQDMNIAENFTEVQAAYCDQVQVAAADSQEFYSSGFELDREMIMPNEVVTNTTFVYDTSSAYFVSIDYPDPATNWK